MPTVDEALSFIDEYEGARGMAFTDEERRAAHAAAVWIRAYSARCGHAVGERDRRRSRLEEYAEALL